LPGHRSRCGQAVRHLWLIFLCFLTGRSPCAKDVCKIVLKTFVASSFRSIGEFRRQMFGGERVQCGRHLVGPDGRPLHRLFKAAPDDATQEDRRGCGKLSYPMGLGLEGWSARGLLGRAIRQARPADHHGGEPRAISHRLKARLSRWPIRMLGNRSLVNGQDFLAFGQYPRRDDCGRFPRGTRRGFRANAESLSGRHSMALDREVRDTNSANSRPANRQPVIFDPRWPSAIFRRGLWHRIFIAPPGGFQPIYPPHPEARPAARDIRRHLIHPGQSGASKKIPSPRSLFLGNLFSRSPALMRG